MQRLVKIQKGKQRLNQIVPSSDDSKRQIKSQNVTPPPQLQLEAIWKEAAVQADLMPGLT